jgi:Na+-translocating ferredoxin:NAD+ oxidoreductase subunit B
VFLRRLKMNSNSKTNAPVDRRRFLTDGARAVGAVGLGALGGFLIGRQGNATEMTWQLDPAKCIACGNCATHCVLDISAVKCLHSFPMCGYCKLCTGYFEPEPNALNSGAENQLCPTGAVKRRFIEDPYYEYEIEEDLCIGCGKCVKGCSTFGNGSLYLQVRSSLCLNCNECSIAVACPSQAFSRVPANSSYMPKTAGPAGVDSPQSADEPQTDDTSHGEATT